MLAVLAVGCAEAGGVAEAGGADAVSLLPECGAPPTASEDATVPGLALPEGAIVTGVKPQEPITSVNGYVAMTPIQVRAHYAELDDVEVMAIEDEVFEAEVLVATGGHRMYLKARAHCAEGSSLLAIVAPDVDADGLPIPDGTPDPLATDG